MVSGTVQEAQALQTQRQAELEAAQNRYSQIEAQYGYQSKQARAYRNRELRKAQSNLSQAQRKESRLRARANRSAEARATREERAAAGIKNAPTLQEQITIQRARARVNNLSANQEVINQPQTYTVTTDRGTISVSPALAAKIQRDQQAQARNQAAKTITREQVYRGGPTRAESFIMRGQQERARQQVILSTSPPRPNTFIAGSNARGLPRTIREYRDSTGTPRNTVLSKSFTSITRAGKNYESRADPFTGSVVESVTRNPASTLRRAGTATIIGGGLGLLTRIPAVASATERAVTGVSTTFASSNLVRGTAQAGATALVGATAVYPRGAGRAVGAVLPETVGGGIGFVATAPRAVVRVGSTISRAERVSAGTRGTLTGTAIPQRTTTPVSVRYPSGATVNYEIGRTSTLRTLGNQATLRLGQTTQRFESGFSTTLGQARPATLRGNIQYNVPEGFSVLRVAGPRQQFVARTIVQENLGTTGLGDRIVRLRGAATTRTGVPFARTTSTSRFDTYLIGEEGQIAELSGYPLRVVERRFVGNARTSTTPIVTENPSVVSVPRVLTDRRGAASLPRSNELGTRQFRSTTAPNSNTAALSTAAPSPIVSPQLPFRPGAGFGGGLTSAVPDFQRTTITPTITAAPTPIYDVDTRPRTIQRPSFAPIVTPISSTTPQSTPISSPRSLSGAGTRSVSRVSTVPSTTPITTPISTPITTPINTPINNAPPIPNTNAPSPLNINLQGFTPPTPLFDSELRTGSLQNNKRNNKRKKRRNEYSPSLLARSLNIQSTTGKKQTGFTGFELRGL